MNPWRGLAGLPRESWILFVVALVNRAGTMVMPFLVLYLTQAIGLPAAKAGLAVAAFGIGAIVCGPPSGYIADRIGGLAVMRLSLACSGLILIVLMMVKSLVATLVACFVWAIVSESFRPANLMLLTGIVAPNQRKAAVALNRLAVNLGMSIGPAVAGFLAAWSFKWLFIIDSITSMIAAAILTFSHWTIPDARAAKHSFRKPPENHLDTSSTPTDLRTLLYFLFALLPALIVFFQTQAAMPLYLVRDIKITESGFGVLLSVNTVLIILIELPLNQATASWSYRRSLPLGGLLCGLGFWLLMFAQGFWSAAASVCVWTLGEIILFPASAAYVADISPEHRRGTYMGLYQLIFSVAFTIGPWAGTQILEVYGARWLWTSALCFGGLSALLMTTLKVGKAGSP